MNTDVNSGMSRKDFLRGFLSGLASEFRDVCTEASKLPEPVFLPPGSRSWSHLRAHCTQCGECVSVCPHEALRITWDKGEVCEGLPGIHAGITACMECEGRPCIEACTSGALDPGVTGARGLTLVIDTNRCLAHQDQFCMSCVNQCPSESQALTMNSTGHPEWNQDNCSGCGICVQACPAPGGAFTVNYREEECP